MEQLIKDKKKEPNKKVFRGLSGVVIRDDEWTRTLDDWLEIYKYYKDELLRNKQKFHSRRKNKKDNRQY